MPENVEIKARVEDIHRIRPRVEALATEGPEYMEQEDVFFRAPERLKLRRLGPDRGELIAYRRSDVEGPRRSDYRIYRTTRPDTLQEVLAFALGVRAVVRKQRWVYRVGRTRVHLDVVEGLGHFVELEVVLAPGEPEQAGQAEARELMARLGLSEAHLVPQAYVDLLEASPRR